MDEIDLRLLYEVHLDNYAKKVLSKPKEDADKVNALSISSIWKKPTK